MYMSTYIVLKQFVLKYFVKFWTCNVNQHSQKSFAESRFQGMYWLTQLELTITLYNNIN